jgi:hypothetical protein
MLDKFAQIDVRSARVNPWALVAAIVILMLSFEFLIKEVLAVSAVIGTGASAAAQATGTGSGGPITGVSSMLASIGTFIQSSMTTANAKAQLLIPDGQSLLIAIAGMMLAWNAVLWILGGDLEGIMKSFITFVLMWGLAKYALDSYTTLTATIGSGFDYIAAKLGVDPHNFFVTLFQSAYAPFEAVSKVFKDMSAMEWASNLGSIVVMGLLAGIISIVIFIVGAVVMALIAISQVLFSIAVVLGPMLIPFMLLPFLSGLATGWLNYLIYTGFVKVVGVVMIVFMSGFTQSLATMKYESNDGLNMGAYIGAATIAILVAFLATMIMEITSGIVGGSPLRGVLNSGTKSVKATGGKVGGAVKGLKDRFGGAKK